VNDARPGPGWLERAERAGRLIENLALVTILSGMILLASLQIFYRNFLDSGFAWADEALRLMVLWVAMLGAVVASREDRHISIDVLSHVLPETARNWAAVLVNAFTSIVSLNLAWYSALLNDLPAWLFQSILPVAFLLIGYRYGIWCLRRMKALMGGVAIE